MVNIFNECGESNECHYVLLQINILNLYLKLNCNINHYGYLICPQNAMNSTKFIKFFYSWKSFPNILEAICSILKLIVAIFIFLFI